MSDEKLSEFSLFPRPCIISRPPGTCHSSKQTTKYTNRLSGTFEYFEHHIVNAFIMACAEERRISRNTMDEGWWNGVVVVPNMYVLVFSLGFEASEMHNEFVGGKLSDTSAA